MKNLKPTSFIFGDTGKIHAVLPPHTSPLGLNIEGRPYLGYIVKTPYHGAFAALSQGEMVRYKTFDYCGHEVGEYFSQHESARILFDRWVEYGCGGKILFAKKPWHVHLEIDLLVKALNKEDAEKYVMKNTDDWSHLVSDIPIAFIQAKPLHEVPSGWTDYDLLFGPGGDMNVEEAIRVSRMFEAQEKEIQRSLQEYGV